MIVSNRINTPYYPKTGFCGKNGNRILNWIKNDLKETKNTYGIGGIACALFGVCIAGIAAFELGAGYQDNNKRLYYEKELKRMVVPEKVTEIQFKADLVEKYGGSINSNPLKRPGAYLKAVMMTGLNSADDKFKIDSLLSEETKKQLSAIKTLDSSKAAAENTVKFIKSFKK